MSCLTLGIRVSVHPDRVLDEKPHHSRCEVEAYADSLNSFLEEKGMIVLQSTLGIHQKSGARSHFHYHLVLGNEFPFKSPVLQSYKGWAKNLDLPINKCVSIKSQKIPIMEESDTTDTLNRFLQYPLKEDVHVLQYCKTETPLELLQAQAVAEYAAVQIKKNKALNATLKTQGQKKEIYDCLDKFFNPDLMPHELDTYNMCDTALSVLRSADIPYRKIIEHTLQYCYERNTNFGSVSANEFLISSQIRGLKESNLFKVLNHKIT